MQLKELAAYLVGALDGRSSKGMAAPSQLKPEVMYCNDLI